MLRAGRLLLAMVVLVGSEVLAAGPQILVVTTSPDVAGLSAEVRNTVGLFARSNTGISLQLLDAQRGEVASRVRDEANKSETVAVVGPADPVVSAQLRAVLIGAPVIYVSVAAEQPRKGDPRHFRIGTSAGRQLNFLKRNMKQTGVQALSVFMPTETYIGSRAWKDYFGGSTGSVAQDGRDNFVAKAASLESVKGSGALVDAGLFLSEGVAQKAGKLQTIIVSPVAGIGRYTNAFTGRSNLFVLTVPGPQTSEGQSFEGKYSSEFKSLPNLGAAYQTYSALEVIAASVKKLGQGGSDREGRASSLAGFIRDTTFKTIVGSLKFDQSGESNWDSEAIWQLGGPPKILASGTGGSPPDCGLCDCCKRQGCTSCPTGCAK
jgi:hypothetical protein